LGAYDKSKQTGASTRLRSKRGGFKHPLSIPMDTVATAWASDEAINKTADVGVNEDSGKRSSDWGEEGKDAAGRPFSSERGSKSNGSGSGRVGGGGLGAIQIMKTREYKATEE
jgi:hypothetical protein